ncbi:sensor histidine kinase KdpD [Mangrovibacterium marinum]|uniref:histidine kinase n=1 Tax=Mangrovibacterium marinum TaxID=1639118 RepID=A0A2T5C5B0_9BACT|nr:HAMP domain-containing sensor histidine kinase [Mangrovibacterium marinum]PTN10079.1 signal transduction histidine kinase [Mangrovibacterium marinum]
MTKFKQFLYYLVSNADLSSYESFEDKKKSFLLYLFSYFFVTLMLGFMIYNALSGDFGFLIANSIALVVSSLLYYLFKEKKMLHFVTTFFVVTIMLLTTFFAQTGGIDRTGLYFTILIPLPTILLVGRRKGLLLLLTFVTVNLLGFILFADLDWYPHYNMDNGGRLGIIFFLITLMAYANEYAFDFLYRRIEKLSESLVQSQQGFKDLAVSKERFVSLISNNLSDHIGGFAGIANLLNDEYDELDEKHKRDLIRSLANFSQQNYRLLGDLMKWSTSQTGTISYQPRAVKVEKIYRDVVELYHPQIEDKKLSFFLKMKSNSEVYADVDMAGAILRIFVSNAIKFSREGGEVRISAEEEGDDMRITVSDKGVGMSEENLLRANSSVPFSNPGSLNEPGVGIGLILAKEFLQKNKGTFFIESTLGLGTVVSFTLPLVE